MDAEGVDARGGNMGAAGGGENDIKRDGTFRVKPIGYWDGVPFTGG